jgi:Rad3-related DNA helicase
MNILSFVPPGWSLRDEQRDVLLQVQDAWIGHDVCVVVAPTAFGKTLLEYVIAKWAAAQKQDCCILAPNNVITEQIHGVFPDVPLLRRKDSYPDDKAYRVAQLTAKRSKVRLTNFHVCFANKLAAAVHVIDEGHTTVEMLQDRYDIKIWQREYPFPSDMRRVADVIEWGQRHLKTLPEGRSQARLRRALKDIVAVSSDATVEYRLDMYKGRATQVLVVIPGLERKAPDWLWPKFKTRKLVFLSATFSREDIRELGLGHLRVKYIECPSPIPPANRPVLFRPWVNMGSKYQEHAMPEFARRLLAELDRRPEKGLVHLPYNLASWLRDLIGEHPRLLWHDKDNKLAVLDDFRQSPPEHGKVLVASGLFEGVDLPYSAARWQVIGKVPYLSLGDEKVRRRSAQHPQWYEWEALKRIIQATGRIVRAPDDFGETLIWDVNFEQILRDRHKLIPSYFRDAIKVLPR